MEEREALAEAIGCTHVPSPQCGGSYEQEDPMALDGIRLGNNAREGYHHDGGEEQFDLCGLQRVQHRSVVGGYAQVSVQRYFLRWRDSYQGGCRWE
jgi:hypothetical protein